MVNRPLKVILDTNILISSIVFGGKPEQILRKVIEKEVENVTSLTLLAELSRILAEKFNLEYESIKLIEKQMRKNFILTQPTEKLIVLKDEADNRVLEAAAKENCDYIVTGDKQILKLARFKNTKIITSTKFLEILDQK